MKKLIAVAAFVLVCGIVAGQKYQTSVGSVSFSSKATLEDIEAKNNQVKALLDADKGEVAFIVFIKSFEFDKQLMQTHFNDNYMESDKYKDARFEGKINNNSDVKYNTDGTYDVTVSGKLTIRGITKDVTASGTITVSGSNLTIKSSFKVKLEDYGIKNDKIKNIASDIDVSVNTTLAKKN